MADAEEPTDATLELTIISADNLNGKEPSSSSFLSKSNKFFAIAWVDPTQKQKSKSLLRHRNQKLHFPLTSHALRNPTSSLTIQILASRPLQNPKLLGTANLTFSRIHFAGDPLKLQLRRPDGGPHCGAVCLTARILWCLGPLSTSSVSVSDLPVVHPSAPPMPDPVPSLTAEAVAIPDDDLTELPMRNSTATSLSEAMPVMPCANILMVPPVPYFAPVLKDLPAVPPGGGGAWRSFLVGMAGGALAAALVLVGAATEFLGD